MLPSELLEQALDDLELCMKEPGYKIDSTRPAEQNVLFELTWLRPARCLDVSK